MIDTFYLDFMIPMAIIPFLTLLVARMLKPSPTRIVVLIVAYVVIATGVLTLQEAFNFYFAYRGDINSSLGESLRMLFSVIVSFPITFIALAYLERQRK